MEADMKIERRQFVALIGSLAATAGSQSLLADDSNLVEPVHRVANAASVAPTPDVHPLDRALDIARRGLASSQANVNDYTAVLVKREEIGGTLNPHEYMFVKVRNRKVADGQVVQPLSVYLNFLKPTAIKGREVIYVATLWPTKAVSKVAFCPPFPFPPMACLRCVASGIR